MLQNISPFVLVITIAIYFIILYGISYWTGRNADTRTFFNAHRQSSWILVAIGMIGASLSGVTFISIPGVVGAGGVNQAFSYMQMVMGYLVGYLVIAHVLMPLYYRHNLITIYGYLERRFGKVSYKTGAFYFLLSRVIGASFRLYLVALVLYPFVLRPLGISFEVTVFITLALIWVYTFKGGIKTIVWTDTIQTVTMLSAVVMAILAITKAMETTLPDVLDQVRTAGYARVFFFEDGWADPNNFFKQFASGALIAITMTGLDQDMMQKNLTCRSLRAAQKNIYLFSIILVFANLLFLTLGAILYVFAQNQGIAIPEKTDQLFPLIALGYLPPFIGVVFLVGLIAAAYSSADSALTALTTSFCIDFLNFESDKRRDETNKRRTRIRVHIGFTVLLFFVIIIFNALNNDAVINGLFKAAGYTYGPILGLFAFGVLLKRRIRDRYAWIILLIAPVLSYIIDTHSDDLFNGFKFGFFILALNGALTFAGLLLLSKKDTQ